MKVQSKFQILIFSLLIISLMAGCSSTQTTITNQSSSTQGFGVDEEALSEEMPEEVSEEESEAPHTEESEESSEENVSVASAFNIVVAWTVVSSDFTELPENPILVTMVDSVMTVETECYMFSGRYTADPRLSITPLTEIDSQCDNISTEEQALVDMLPNAHSFHFRSDTSVELAYGDGLVIVLEAQNDTPSTEADTAQAASNVSD